MWPRTRPSREDGFWLPWLTIRQIDILRTITACFDNYTHVQQGLQPFGQDIWSSLKYEVRNGEVDETIQAALEVIRQFSKRLDGEDLAAFVFSVMRDCLEDLSNPTYVEGAGKLLLCVLAASPNAFAIAVTPTITQCKDNLRRPKSPAHAAGILSLLNSMLSVRLQIIGTGLPEVSLETQALRTTDPAITALFDDVYAPNCVLVADSLTKPSIKATPAIQGMGLLMTQPAAHSIATSFARLLPTELCDRIYRKISELVLDPTSVFPSLDQPDSWDFLPAATLAMHQAAGAYPAGWKPFLDAFVQTSRDLVQLSESDHLKRTLIDRLFARVAYISSSRPNSGDRQTLFNDFLSCIVHEFLELRKRGDAPEYWVSYVASIQRAYLFLVDSLDDAERKWLSNVYQGQGWIDYIAQKFPTIPRLVRLDIEARKAHQQPVGQSPPSTAAPSADVDCSTLQDASLFVLFIVRQFWRSGTSFAVLDGSSVPIVNFNKVWLRGFRNGTVLDRRVKEEFWNQVANLTRSVVERIPGTEQAQMDLPIEVLHLFQARDYVAANDGGAALSDITISKTISVVEAPIKTQPTFFFQAVVFSKSGPVPFLHPALFEPFYPLATQAMVS